MNKRVKKKKEKQLIKYIEKNFDVLDGNGNYHTISIKCHSCQNYESADPSIGLIEGCIAEVLYDENDEIIEKMNNKIIHYMHDTLGYNCPYFKKIVKTNKDI